jgi:SAM-dependent methyltransferase
MTQKTSLYEDVWFYDLVRESWSDPAQLDFFQRQIKRFGGPVLELACGSGYYLVPFTKNGVDITGLDLSGEMLRAARAKAERAGVKIIFFQGDMRNFNLHKRFNLIFVANNSFQHLLTVEDFEGCLAAVKRHLEPHGKFIIDVFNPSLILLSRNPEERYHFGEFESSKGKIIFTENVRYDAATQINYLDWHFQNLATGEEKTLSFSLRMFFPQELDALISYNGFQIEQKFGGYDESPFSGQSPKQIILVSPL